MTVAYLALLRQEELELKASSDASGVAWWPVNQLPELAFDHADIISYARKRLRYKIEYSPAAFMLIPEKFTLRDLQMVYEAVLGRNVDNRNFRKKFLNTGVLQELDETSQETSFRPARLYNFSEGEFEDFQIVQFFFSRHHIQYHMLNTRLKTSALLLTMSVMLGSAQTAKSQSHNWNMQARTQAENANSRA